MSPLLKPRGFWDYAIFALIMTAGLVFLFWLGATGGIGWPDAALALTAAVFLVLAIIVARRGEKARWVVRPTWHVQLLASLGVLVLMFATVYADSYLLHRSDITSKRLVRDGVLAIALIAGTLWSSRKRRSPSRQLL